MRPLVVLWSHHGRGADPELLKGISDQAEAFGWELLDLRFTYGELPAGREVAGALVEALPPDRIALALREMGVPAVRIGYRSHPQDNLLPPVLPDISAAARMAIEHFVEKGIKTVGYVGRDPWANGSAFFDEFQKWAIELGCDCRLIQIPRAPESRAGRYKMRYKVLANWLPALPKPIGVMATTDRDAGLLCTVCQSVGLRVPEDVAVLGNGNRELDCEMAPVPLSSLDWAKGQQGVRACELLRDLMIVAEYPEEPILVEPAGVVGRRSTDIVIS